MAPTSIQRLLKRVRSRERALALSWALACWLGLCLGVFVLFCTVDWLIDRRQETPAALRATMLGVQVLLWGEALVMILRPVLRRLPDDWIALLIEERVPSLGHRLISAVQLNRPGARTQGMSEELIRAVTAQAERQTAEIQPGQVCDQRRFTWAARLLGPVSVAVIVLVLLSPSTWTALALRVFLLDRDIPRSITLTAISPEVWPANEEGVLKFRITGKVPAPEVVGEVRIEPEGPALRLGLMASDVEDVFEAKVPAADMPFRYRAWLADARLRSPGEVRYSPRPVIGSLQTWVQLPVSLLGKRANGTAFEEPQRGGDVVTRLPGCRARVAATAQVEISAGDVHIAGKQPRRVAMTAGGTTAEAEFDLLPGDESYQVVVRDQHGFGSNDPPRRTIRHVPVDPPEVTLLPETFWQEGDTGPMEDREVEGIPILEGKSFRLDYRCSDRYGLSHVVLRYRVLPRSSKPEEESSVVEPAEFLPLPLGPVRGQPLTARAKEEFFTRKAASAEELPDREGGGRCDFNSTGIADGKGGTTQLREGDRIQFFVEVYSKAHPDGPPGRSALRDKEVVGLKEYFIWLEKKEDLKERTRYLEEQQRGVRPSGM